MSEAHVLRSRFGRILAGSIGAVCAAAAIILIIQSPPDAWRVVPLLALLAFAAWAAYWAPYVRVDDDGVAVANVFRTIHVPWGQIQRIDTRFALTLYTSHGRVSAWAAPAPGRHALLFTQREQGKHLPETSYLDGTVRPGDLVGSDSGAAAYVVRRQWEKLRDAGALVDDGAPRDVRLHIATITTGALLVVAVVLSMVL
ncbi:hypothetical protein GCM10022200_08610 [Microbacterium awajiense]|uniref:Low molecular weight protein antigen 6 PH domain-containing protein n=1 Tax=Microbacterium awajiense TaxID=415214 RepID=A0ABP7AAL6_9MICO